MRFAKKSVTALNVVAMLLWLIVGCNNSVPIKTEAELAAEWEEERNLNYPLIDGSNEPRLTTFALVDNWTAIRGLPHQNMEREAFEREAARAETTKIDEYLFYAKSRQPLTREDATKLSGLLITKGTFRTWLGEKLCGGFHPDVALHWMHDDHDYYLLACFGCHEVKIIGPLGGVTYDMENADELIKILKPYS